MNGMFSLQCFLSISLTAADDDFIPVALNFTFDSTVGSHCFNVSINDDLLVEGSEEFFVSLSTADPSVSLVPLTTVIITDEDGKMIFFSFYIVRSLFRVPITPKFVFSCSVYSSILCFRIPRFMRMYLQICTPSPTQTVLCPASRTVSLRGNYDWEERPPNREIELPCQFGEALPGGMVRRFCGPGGRWEDPTLEECYADADALFDAIFNVRRSIFECSSWKLIQSNMTDLLSGRDRPPSPRKTSGS